MINQDDYMIETKNLGYQVGKQKLLSGINLKIKKGEHWLLYGMNGCGKTTLLSILAGFQQQTQGELNVFGAAYSNDNILENRKRIGWISSSFFDVRYHKERVIDIVLSGKFGTYGLAWDLNSTDYIRAMDLLTELGLGDKAHNSYDRLSKGQRQNVLIARAFMGKPEILLLDEPCSGLDVLAKARFWTLLKSLIQQKEITVLYVSHEINHEHELFPNIIMLRNGRLFTQGPIERLFHQEELSKFFQQAVEFTTRLEKEITPVNDHKQLDLHLFLD